MNEDLIREARKAATAVYLAAPEPVAADLSRIITGLADTLEAATAPEPATVDFMGQPALNPKFKHAPEPAALSDEPSDAEYTDADAAYQAWRDTGQGSIHPVKAREGFDAGWAGCKHERGER